MKAYVAICTLYHLQLTLHVLFKTNLHSFEYRKRFDKAFSIKLLFYWEMCLFRGLSLCVEEHCW